jgi:hypothetical protein
MTSTASSSPCSAAWPVAAWDNSRASRRRSDSWAQRRLRPRTVGYPRLHCGCAYSTGSKAVQSQLNIAGLRGYVEHRNIRIDYRRTPECDQLPAMAAELVRGHVSVILAGAAVAELAAKAATTTIPTVLIGGEDTVCAGLAYLVSS